MNDHNKPKFPRQGKAADANQALIAAVSLLGASLGVTAATPAGAGTVDVHTPQVQTPKVILHTPTIGSPKVTKTYSNTPKLQSTYEKPLEFQSNQHKLESNQDKTSTTLFQSNQHKSQN